MNQSSETSILVVGGGGAGIVAAWKAAACGAPVVLFERNRKLGIKLLISGGGKCNITHAGPIREVLKQFLRNESRFLQHSMHEFSNNAIIDLLEQRGVKTMTRDNGRVFPESGNADDVVGALQGCLRESQVDVRLSQRVRNVTSDAGKITGIVVGEESIPSAHVVLATGGASYPKTGTTGDGYRWARSLGHAVVPIRSALAPIAIKPGLPKGWHGVAIRDGALSACSGREELISWNDDILFSHEGITGPAALEVSRTAAHAMEQGEVRLRFDFFPSKDFSVVERELLALVDSHRGKTMTSILEMWLPNRLVPFLLQYADVDGTTKGYVLTRDDRKKIALMLKSWEIGIIDRIPMERGEVSAGGVSLEEVDSRTMRSLKIRGLYLCGEILDVAGPVGGYNLQAAFSTGYVAGQSAAEDWLASCGREFSGDDVRSYTINQQVDSDE